MKDLIDFLEPLHMIIVGALVIGIYGLFRVLKWLDHVQLYDECPRCGWKLPIKHVFKDHCYGCQNMSDKSVENMTGRKIFKTGYKIKK